MVDKQDYIELEDFSRSRWALLMLVIPLATWAEHREECKKTKYLCITVVLFFSPLQATVAWKDALGSMVGESAVKIVFFLYC